MRKWNPKAIDQLTDSELTIEEGEAEKEHAELLANKVSLERLIDRYNAKLVAIEGRKQELKAERGKRKK